MPILEDVNVNISRLSEGKPPYGWIKRPNLSESVTKESIGEGTSEKCVDCANPKVLKGMNLCARCAKKRGRRRSESMVEAKVMFLTAADKRKLPKIGSTDKQKDPTVWVKFFNPYGSGTWLITEYDGKETMFGYVMGLGGDELGYIDLGELMSLKTPFGAQKIERDRHFKPMPLTKAIRKEGGSVPRWMSDRAEKEMTEDTVFLKHQLKIARATVKMNPAMRGVMGGMSLRQAHMLLREHGTAKEKRAAQVWLADNGEEVGESMITEVSPRNQKRLNNTQLPPKIARALKGTDLTAHKPMSYDKERKDDPEAFDIVCWECEESIMGEESMEATLAWIKDHRRHQEQPEYEVGESMITEVSPRNQKRLNNTQLPPKIARALKGTDLTAHKPMSYDKERKDDPEAFDIVCWECEESIMGEKSMEATLAWIKDHRRHQEQPEYDRFSDDGEDPGFYRE